MTQGDAFEATVDRTPLIRGGANFRTHELLQRDRRLVVVRSAAGRAFLVAFRGVAFLAVAFGVMLLIRGDLSGAIPVMVGIALLLVAFGAMKREPPLTFDFTQGVYFRGAALRQGIDAPATQGRLSTIRGVQMLTEQIASTRANSRATYASHEVNLVLDDASRVNVLDHGDEAAARASAQGLADALGVPLWQVSGSANGAS